MHLCGSVALSVWMCVAGANKVEDIASFKRYLKAHKGQGVVLVNFRLWF